MKGSRCVVNIVSFVSKSNAFEWVVEGLKKQPYRLVFILLHSEKTPFEDFLVKEGITVYRIHYTGKKTLLSAFYKVTRILLKERAQVVHCHLFDACIVGLPAARLLNIRRRIYTRHNSTIHHVYFPKAVKYDKFINAMSTDILAISQRVKRVMVELENVDPKKIHLVPHGFDFQVFDHINEGRVQHVREKYQLHENTYPVIGVVSRYIHWKGIRYIIPAFKRFLSDHPNAVLVLANANGPYNKEIKVQLQAELPAECYREIEFEGDIIALYRTMDAFVHVPIDDHSEAFGQVYVEALASGIPSVFTLSGIAIEFIRHKENALVVDFKSSDAIYNALMELFQKKDLYSHSIENGKESVKLFDINIMIENLNKLYQD